MVLPGPDGSVTRICEGLYFPTMLVDGGQSLIVAETYRHRLWKGAWDAGQRQWRDPKAWAEVGGPIGPDGMAVGADGQLYVAVYGSGQIKVVAAAGAVTAAYALPGANPTNVARPLARWPVVTEEHGAFSLPALGTGRRLMDA
jgi:gluconolactonase